MKHKTTAEAPAPPAILHLLMHGEHDVTLEGAFEAYQLGNPRNNYEALRPYWTACRAWILAARQPGDPEPWGMRFEKETC